MGGLCGSEPDGTEVDVDQPLTKTSFHNVSLIKLSVRRVEPGRRSVHTVFMTFFKQVHSIGRFL